MTISIRKYKIGKMCEFKQLTKISETSYLNADNAERYRAIMRVFFHADQHYSDSLYKEDVMRLLKEQFPQYSDLSMDQLKLDLAQLVEWKNLEAVQDPRHVYTIAEYKNKKFRYSMTPASVEIERMTLRLESLYLETSSLSSNYFVRLEGQLAEVNHLKERELKDVGEWWSSLQDDFRSMIENYRDYLREFYSGSGEKILKSVEFVIHKDRFVTYLKEFIVELQAHTDRIAGMLRRIDAEQKEDMLERITASQLDIPRLANEKHENLEEEIREDIRAKWKSLEHWFLVIDGQPSESSRILDVTNDIIDRIIQNAALIVRLQDYGLSRRGDYERWIGMFNDCESMEDAHKLSAFLFGAGSVRHYTVNESRSTDSISSSSAEEEPFVYTLSSHSRTYRPRVEREAYTSRDLFKQQKKQEYLERMEKCRQEAQKYIHDGKLVFNKIDGIVSSDLRGVMLKWIADANINASHTGRTEYGQRYHLKKEEGNCVLHCEDGDLTMPCYVIEFKDE